MTAATFPALLFLTWAALAIIGAAWGWWRESPRRFHPRLRVTGDARAYFRYWQTRAALRAILTCFGGYIVTALLTFPFWV